MKIESIWEVSGLLSYVVGADNQVEIPHSPLHSVWMANGFLITYLIKTLLTDELD